MVYTIINYGIYHTIINYGIYLNQNISIFQYTVYFIRGVDNTLTEFDAKAVIDTSHCRLDIPLDWASCVLACDMPIKSCSSITHGR